jgi:hypothetical protein
MVEEALWEIRQRLPFVRMSGVELSAAPAKVSNANFSLAIADLHHNAGNLYFFKGRHSTEGGPGYGYLDRAYYHYAVALHEVRRSHAHRYGSASRKLNPYGDSENPLARAVLPDFVLRRTTAALFGLADMWLAQVSVEALAKGNRLELLQNLVPGPPTNPGARMRAWFAEWLASVDGRPQKGESIEDPVKVGMLTWWVGAWRYVVPGRASSGKSMSTGSASAEDAGKLVQLRRIKDEHRRVAGYLGFSRLGATLLADGGHYEEAAHELFRIAGSIDGLLGALEAYCHVTQNRDPKAVYLELLEEGAEVLEEAEGLLRLRFVSWMDEPADQRCGVEARVPAHARRLARTLGLAAVRHSIQTVDSSEESRRTRACVWRFAVLTDRWTGTEGGMGGQVKEKHYALEMLEPMFRLMETYGLVDTEEFQQQWEGFLGQARAWFRGGLRRSLEKDAYPILNHLMTLRAAIFDQVLASDDRGASGAEMEVAPLDHLVAELRDLDRHYGSVMHLTPFHVGTALALAGLSTPGLAQEARGPLALEARRQLERSQHMYSSRSAYYEAIEDLYYLDDDFNDRCVHVRHALQMMGSELTSLLILKLQSLT